MARLISKEKRNRLKPRDSITWLTHEQRQKQRATLKYFGDIIEMMEERKPLPPSAIEFLKNYTGSDNPDTWLEACWKTYDTQENHYFGILGDMAQHDLTAYHEFMRPEEPPAPHHIWLCDILMRAERGELGFVGISLPPGSAKSTYGSRSFVQWFMGRHPTKRILAVGHALDINTEIPTPNGFVLMRDLRIGDEVFARDGTPTKITAKSEVFTGRECYEVTTSDGSTVVTDANHLWTIEGYKEPVTTAQIEEMSSRKALPKVSPVVYETKSLPIEPYVFGQWLGDGDSHGAKVTTGERDKPWVVEEFNRLGYPTKETGSNKHRVYVSLLHKQLRENGLLRNKHIPVEYMTASVAQRVALLQGLCDADGDASKDGDRHAFSNTNKKLIDDVRELLWSLGVKNKLLYIPPSVKTINGKDYDCKESWRIHFLSTFTFRLPRKAQYNKEGKKNRTITARKIETRPTQCIVVDNPDRLFLATRAYIPTHNSQRFVEDEFSKPNRDVIATDEYARAFPDVMLSENDRGATTWSIENYKGDYTCRGANAGVAGLRANLLNIDDPIKSVKDAQSEVVRDGLFRWITGDLFSRRLPGCPIVMIMTRWHSEDPMGRLEKLHNENPDALPGPVQFINIPAQAVADDPLDRKPGEWLWESFYGAKHYETLRATMAPGLWSALYLGVPLDKMGQFVAESDFQRYDKAPGKDAKSPVKIRKTVISVDTAQKGSERSAYTAIQVFREGSDGRHYLVFAHRMQHKLDDVIKYLAKSAINWEANYILIENAGMGTQILENNADSFVCPLIPANPQKQGSKEFRFDAATPWIISGKVLFPKQAPWLADLVNEMVAFPDGKFKDQCDAFSQYCNHVMRRAGGGVRRLVMGA